MQLTIPLFLLILSGNNQPSRLIDALPHQLIAVYDYMLKQPRLRFLLADDAGAGKTIMAGLYNPRDALAPTVYVRALVWPIPPEPSEEDLRQAQRRRDEKVEAIAMKGVTIDAADLPVWSM